VLTILKAAEMREVDRLTTERFGIPSLLLMETAASCAADQIVRLFPEGIQDKRVLVICGPGNNGGDGAAVARRLWLGGADVKVVLLVPFSKTRGNARANFEIVRRLSETGHAKKGSEGRLTYAQWTEARRAAALEDEMGRKDVIVDAIFGTGVTRPLEGVFLEAVKAINRSRSRRLSANSTPLIVSLDLPSGLDSDSANPIGDAVQADLTVTFTAPKSANVLPPASHYSGRLIVAGIGTPESLLKERTQGFFLTDGADARAWLKRTRYSPGSYKNTHGHALVIAGSRRMTGAAVLCSNAVMRSGAGLVTLVTPKGALHLAVPRLMPEVMCIDVDETEIGTIAAEATGRVQEIMSRMTVAAIGPGLNSDAESTRSFIRGVIENRSIPLVIDADGLNSLAPWPSNLKGSAEAPLILTPHPGEMLRLLGTEDKSVLSDRVNVAREFATTHHVILVLKGERTIVANPDGNVYLNYSGNPGLGTAGAGDTLTGIITGFMAQEFGMFRNDPNATAATVAAVYVGGVAGDLAATKLGMRTMTASDISKNLPEAVKFLDPDGEQP
jgi:hydroxyethylthiazole kinase-like uncharacterized protein yjeF